MTEARCHYCFEDGRWGYEPRNTRNVALEDGKGKETGFPLPPPQ